MEKFNAYIIRPADDDSPAFCPKCGQDKPISMYYVHSKRLDGSIRYRPYCKKCRRRGPRLHWARPRHTEILNNGRQICLVCKIEKPLTDFYSNGCFADGIKKYRTRCKDCVLAKLKANNSEIYKTKSEKRSASPKNFISGILNHAAKRKQHLGFDIDIIYLLNLYSQQRGHCAISGIEMTYSAGKGRVHTNVSLDRIDSSRGYLRGNVQLVCDYVNRMKSDLEQRDFVSWCEKIVEHNNG
jgi:hypothetical protein